jgi:probable phosphoglycerate mutase
MSSEHGPLVVLVRHGQTEWSRDGRHTGRTDLPLTEEGRAAARKVGAVLAEYHFVKVLCSPLQRARETCALAGLGEVAEMRPELVEWDYGVYEGRTTTSIRQENPGWSLWRDGAPGGERADNVGARLQPILKELANAGGDVAIFAHGHVLRVLTALWLNLPPADGKLFALDTATISVLGFEREQWVIVKWNESGHLSM